MSFILFLGLSFRLFCLIHEPGRSSSVALETLKDVRLCKVEFAALVRGCFAVQCWRFCLVLLGFVDWDFFFSITVVCEERELILFGMGISILGL